MPRINKRKLHPYQEVGVQFLLDKKRALLADEMGLGKSAQLLGAAEGRTLVVAPAMVLDGGTWIEETLKWLPGGVDLSTAAYSSLCEREGRKAAPRPRPELLEDWDTVIFDEAHYLKNHRARWTQAAHKIAERSKRVYLATGTPIPNWQHELFSLLRLLRPDDAKPGGELGSYHKWVERWFRVTPNRFNKFATDIGGLLACSPECSLRAKDDPCDHFRDFADSNLQGRFLQRRREDVLGDLPPLTVQTVNIPMATEQDKAYKKLKKEFLAELESGEVVVAWSSAAKHTMLDRCTTSLETLAEEKPSVDALLRSSGKLTRLAEDLARRSRPTVVVAHYRDSVEAAAEVARSVGLSAGVVHGGVSRPVRSKVVQEFKDGKLDVLVGSLDTLSEGLTLTVADAIVFLETSYRPSRNQQAMRRIHRIGQTRPCLVLDYVSVTADGKGTIDSNKRALLASKTDEQLRFLSAAQLSELI